jgi:hypothetical protein
MATEAEPELSQAEVEAAVGLELLARTFPREMAMYRTHGCEHPYAEEGLDGALRLLSHDYCRLIEEILTEGTRWNALVRVTVPSLGPPPSCRPERAEKRKEKKERKMV